MFKINKSTIKKEKLIFQEEWASLLAKDYSDRSTLTYLWIMSKRKITNSPFKGWMEHARANCLVHSNVCGPLNVSPKGGYSFSINFTSDYYRHGYVYLLKHSEAFQKFKKFILRVAN